MEVTVETVGPCQAKIRFTVPGSEFQGTMKRALQNAGKNANMKGFRPGHVPPQIIQKHYGQQIKNETIEHFVRQAYEQAVKEKALKVVGFQRVNVDEIQILEGTDFSHAFELSLRPEIQLGTYKGIVVESELEPVLDQEVDAAIENVERQQSHPEPAGDDGLPADGMALAKVEWLAGDENVLTRDGLRISPASPTPGTDPAAFEKALTGAKDGDVREVSMTFPADYEKESLRGKTGITRITIGQAYRLVPPTRDELFKLLNVTDEAALKVLVREKLGEAKAVQENGRVENVILEKLVGSHTFDVPQMMVDEQTNARLGQLKQQMTQQGASAEAAEKQAESQRENARTASLRGVRTLFLMQAIAEKENLLVTRDDMQAEVQQIAERNNAKVEEVVKYYQEKNLFDQMAVELLERKVRKFLRESAQIKEPS